MKIASGRSGRRFGTIAISVVAVTAGSLQAISLAAPTLDGHSDHPPLGPLVSVAPAARVVAPAATGARAVVTGAPAATPMAAPARPGTYTISLSSGVKPPAASLWRPAGSSGIAVSTAVARGTATVSRVTVSVLSPAEKARYGLTGTVLRLSRADGSQSAGPVSVQLPASVLAGRFGADYANRARWVQLPVTATAAQLSSAAVRPSDVTALHRPDGSMVLTPSVSGAGILLATTSTPSSSGGTWSATSLKTSATWQVSTQSGDFEWSYPFRVPPAAAGPTPGLALSYSSGSVDGETISTNNQSSVVGEGWQLSGTGFIERSYNGCSVDGSGLPAEQVASGDLCWNGENDSISFGGHSGILVPTGTAGSFRVEGDDGSRVDYLPNSTTCHDGGHDNGCWRLTTQDGTQYFFGRSATSAWTAPVYGDDTGEPCHAATFATSVCTQVWRWNLDYVQDVHGNTEQFVYHTEVNYYHRDRAGLVSYVRGGYLTEVDYGMRAGSSTVTQRVLLSYDTYGRCNQTTRNTTTCTNVSGTTYTSPTTPANYPDVPWDQNCLAGGTCTGLNTPTFWTAQMLNSIATSVLVGGTWTTADSWTMTHDWTPSGDTSATSMWLASVTHAGLPANTFQGQFLDNRVWSAHAVGGYNLGGLSKRRLITINTEIGGQLLIDYDTPDCTAAMVQAGQLTASSNTHQCYPQWWSPPGLAMQQDWFYKYRVKDVIQVPVTGGTKDPSVETDYIYTGTPAWRFDQSAATLASRRTWSAFAGYSSVETRLGDPATPATQQVTDYRYFQGLDNDAAGTDPHDPLATRRSVTISDAAGAHTMADSLWFAGRTLETTVRIGSSGGTGQSSTPVLTDTVSLPWAAPATGSGTLTYSYTDPAAPSTPYHGVLSWLSYITGAASNIVTSTLAGGATRTVTTTSNHDGYGRLTQLESATSDAGTTCTQVSYVTDTAGHTDTALWLLGLPAQVSTVDLACSATPVYPTDAISAVRYFYDGATTSGDQHLNVGDLTETDVAKGYAGSTASTADWLTTGTSATTDYDALGRRLTVTDVESHATTIAYTPTGQGPVTSTRVTNSVQPTWSTITAVSPLWARRHPRRT